MVGPGAFRLILALIVVFYHITRYIFLGEFAVYAFFVLSGYWVTKMYEEKYSRTRGPMLTFYVSRVMRLLPVYALAVLCILPLLYIYRQETFQSIQLLEGPRRFLYYFSNFFLIGYNIQRPQVIVPAWSLDIEMQFYLVLPFLVFLIRSFSLKLLSLMALGVSILITFVIGNGILHLTLFGYLPFFLFGILIYKGVNWFNISPKLSLLVFTGLVILQYLVPVFYQHTVGDKNSLYNGIINYVLAITIIPFIRDNVQGRSGLKDKKLGDLSFIVYLFHWVFYIPYSAIVVNYSFLQRVPYMLVYLTVTFSVSWLVYTFYDRKVDQRRANWVKRRLSSTNQKTNKVSEFHFNRSK